MPAKIPPFKAALILNYLSQGITKSEVAQRVGVSRGTIRNVLIRVSNEDEDKKLQPCGTNAAYQRHRRRGERCPECSAAHADSIKAWKDQNER